MAGVDDAARAEVVGLVAGRRVVVAGPGAGKTQLLTDRLVALLDDGAPARDVLVVVFNRAAAAELRARLARSLPGRGFVELRITTFHSLALSLVERQWAALGFPRRPTLIDEEGRRLAITELLAEPDDLDGWGRPAGVRSSEAFVDVVGAGLGSASAGEDAGAMARFRGRYRAQLQSHGLVDLAEVVGLAADLLEDPERVQALGVRHLLVDEVQDLDHEQHRLILLLAGTAQSAILVGDPRQSIYGFRGADPDRLQSLPAELGAEVVELRESHRCRQPVLDAAVALLAGQQPGEGPLVAVSGDDGYPTGIGAIGFPRASDEMDWIAEQVRALNVGGTPWSELAVLCRDTPVTLPAVLAALRRARVPHSSLGVTARVPHPWVLRLDDLLALAVVGRESAEELAALELASASNLVGGDPIAVRTAALDMRESRRPRSALSRWASGGDGSDETRAAVGKLVLALNDAAKAHRGGADAAGVAWRLWRNLPLARRLGSIGDTSALTDQEREGAAAVAAWFRRIQSAADDHPGLTADAWLAGAGADPAADTFLADSALGGGVAVMTVHQAKGLQWDHVFIPGMVEGRFPVAARARPLVDASPAETVTEERRLLYVGITRARFTATLTCTIGAEERMEAAPSRFLRDLVDHLQSPLALLGPRTSHDADSLGSVGTPRQAERTWAKVLRSPVSAPSERVAAAWGLAQLASPTPWIDAPRPPEDRRELRESWSLSATGMEMLDDCGLRFMYDKVLHLSPFDANEQAAFGTAMHAGIAGWLAANEHPDRDLLHARMLERYEETVLPVLPSPSLDGPFRRKLDRIASTTAGWFATGIIGDPVLIEADLAEVHSDGVAIRSRVDLVARNSDGIEIIDWKTGSNNGVSVRGSRQLQTYHWLVRRALQDDAVTKLRLGFVGTPKKLVTNRVSSDFDDDSDAYVDEMVELVRNETFEPQPGKSCERCDYRPICPADPRGQESPW